MVKTIEEVLAPEEIANIRLMQDDMKDVLLGRFLENVLHLECNADPNCEEVRLITYESLKNPYLQLIPYKNVLNAPKRADENELLERRKKHKEFYPGRRHEIVLDELKVREHDILVHKYFLSQRMEKDVGIVMASAHWLKSVSSEFYSLSTLQHKQMDMGFEWEGMEKAVVIAAPNKQEKEEHYVIVMQGDISLEENIAQYTGGIYDTDTKTIRKHLAEIAREKITELHRTNQFCILSAKNK